MGNTTQYLIDPAGLGNVVSTYTASGSLIADYTYGLGLTSQVTAAGSYYYDFDALGSTVGLTDSSGKVVGSMSYLPFGQVAAGNVTVPNPFTFAGKLGVISDGSNNFFMRGREYSAQTGQFLSMDPIGIDGGDVNLRRYVTNSPLQFVDPTGFEQQHADWLGVVRDTVVEANNKLIESPVFKNQVNLALSDVFEAARQRDVPAAIQAYDKFEFLGKVGKVIPGAGAVLTGWSIGTEIREGKYGKAAFEAGEFLLVVFVPEAGIPVLGLNLLIALNDQYHITKFIEDYIDGGDCTLDMVGSAYYLCGGNQVYSQFLSSIGIPGRDCAAQDVADALSASLLASAVALTGSSSSSAGAGQNPGSGLAGFVSPGTSATSNAPPSINTECNCNALITYIDQQLLTASNHVNASTTDLHTVVDGARKIMNTVPTGGTDPDPLPILSVLLGNLGLITGQYGNSGLTASQAAQVIPTLAAFDQWQADISAIETSGANNSEVAGDMALLSKVDGYLQAITTAENALFGGDANWLSTNQTATLQQWMTDFLADAQTSSDGGETVTSAEQAQLLATTLPSSISTNEAVEFIDRWNLTVQYWTAGITTSAQVPAGQSTDFLDAGVLQNLFDAAENAEQASQADGYADPADEYRADLVTVQNDLAGDGVCATIQMQIDQTATLTRTAFTGTLTLNNAMTTDALQDVELDLIITDANGNPVNNAFSISSPTFTGGLTAVDGTGTLAAQSSGTVSYTFIPTDSAAVNGPTLYHIGGTLEFDDPDMGGEVTTSLFPSTITVYPQAQLQLNYFLQQTVIGDDPSTPQIEPSEPAVLGLLVTNVGGGTANNLSITTAQPQIIQNEKGLANTFQIIGTQVGNQQLTPSLTVDLGDVDPGQTADADFVLLSALQGEMENFTATFSHTDAPGRDRDQPDQQRDDSLVDPRR